MARWLLSVMLAAASTGVVAAIGALALTRLLLTRALTVSQHACQVRTGQPLSPLASVHARARACEPRCVVAMQGRLHQAYESAADPAPP